MGPRRRRKVKPLADVTSIYDREDSEYPETLRVPMSNGMVVDYVLKIEQPHPAFREVMHLLDRMPAYGYKAPETKKRRRL